MATVNEKIRSFEQSLRRDLYDQTTTDEGKQFAIDRQISRALKKSLCDDPHLEHTAVSEFLRNNAKVRSSAICVDPRIASEARRFIERALEQFTYEHTGQIQQTLSLGLLMTLWRHGPGASNGVSGTALYHKLSQAMTCTPAAEPLVRLMRRLTRHLWLTDEQHGCQVTVIRGSRLQTVPKNQETNRTIAIEPSGNMCLQLALGAYIEGALRKCGLDISDQWALNRMMAFAGSLSGKLATLDLKAASDLISLPLVQLLWPSDIVNVIERIRSPYIELPDGTERKLWMVSTMGNGFTFPLMTMTILALIYADGVINHSKRIFFIDYKEISVFGDDIIIPTDRFESTCAVLSSAGLVVNYDKSYCSGGFRESCGGDYYNGYDVTPFYVKSLRNDSEVYIAMNKVARWSARHRISMRHTFNYLVSLLRSEPLPVPEWEQDYSGFRMAGACRQYKRLVPIQEKECVEGENLNPHILLMCFLAGATTSKTDNVRITDKTLKQKTIGRDSLIGITSIRGISYKYSFPVRASGDFINYRREDCSIPQGYTNGRDYTAVTLYSQEDSNYIGAVYAPLVVATKAISFEI